MPLLLLTGLPCSGKTRLVHKLMKWFEEKGREEYFPSNTESSGDPNNNVNQVKFKLVNDESLGISKSKYSHDMVEEKRIRGQYLSALERDLDRQDVLVLDAINGIKGLRYQFFCIAKAISTTQAVLHVSAPETDIVKWNSACEHYNSEALRDLIFRYEEPSSFNRWDSPLFSYVNNDQVDSEQDEEELFRNVCNALFKTKRLAPNLSTVKPALRSNTIQRNNLVVKSLCDQIYQAREINAYCEKVKVKLPSDNENENVERWVNLKQSSGHSNSPLTVHELKRHSLQFLNWGKSGARVSPFEKMSLLEIGNSFLDYLEKQWSGGNK